MPTALLISDLTSVDIDTVRGANVDSWVFEFKSIDDVTNFGHIHDNADSFTDGTTSTSIALKIVITSGSENRAILDMDFLDIIYDGATPLRIWLPAISGGGVTTLYVDTDGNTWTDAALTTPAGGVSTVSDSVTFSDSNLDATSFLSDSLTPTDALGTITEISGNIEDSVSLGDSIVEVLKIMTTYFNDIVRLRDSISDVLNEMTTYLNDSVVLSDVVSININESGDFTEDTQTDLTWVEET